MKERKKGRGFAITMVILFLAGCLLIVWSIWDEPEFHDAALDIPERKIDPKENPYPEIRSWELSEEMKENADKLKAMFSGDKNLDREFADRVFKEFEAEIERYEKYAEMSSWKYDGEFRYDTELPELQTFRTVTSVMHSQITDYIEKGDVESAIARTQSLLEFSDHLAHSDGSLIQLLVSMALQKLGLLAVIEIVEEGSPSDEQLVALANTIKQSKLDPPAFDNALRAEYQFFTNTIDDLKSGELKELNGRKVSTSILFKENRTRREAGEYIIHAIKDGTNFRNSSKNEFVAKIESRTMAEKIVSGNFVGEILISIWYPALGTITDAFAENRTAADLVQTRIAIERYRLANAESLPPSLEKLTPKYIDKVPNDLMDGNPIRYVINTDEARIYSIGRDFTDSEGMAQKPGHLRDRDEPVITIPK